MIKMKHKPLHPGQEEELKHAEDRARALFWEPGCGKSKPSIDQAAILEEAGEVDGMFILAPNGVHENWVTDELPMHLPDELAERTRVHQWWTSKAGSRYLKTVSTAPEGSPRYRRERGQVAFRESADETLNHDGFAVLAMSYNGLMTRGGHEYAKAFMKRRRVYYVADESHLGFKTPGSKTTIRVVSSARYAPYRRILTGTPVADKPFDVYSQVEFVDPMAWDRIGISDFDGFKTYFGEWITRTTKEGFDYPVCTEYKNLDEMQAVVHSIGSRLLKKDVLPFLPPKLYSKRYFDLPPAHRRVYDQIRKEFFAELGDGRVLSAPLAITRLLRLQQVCSGYLPDDMDRTLQPIDGNFPRLKLLVQTARGCGHQGIIWAKYTTDIDMIMQALADNGMTAVRYDGQCSEQQCSDAKAAFKNGDAQWFVGNPVKGGTGLTLVNAKTMIYYNTDFKLNPRLQSEDRFHRIGQLDPVQIIDLAGYKTADDYVIHTLREKREVAEVVMGDPIADWI